MWHIVFSHGQESGPWGSKIKRLANTAADLGFSYASIDYRSSKDAEQRVGMLLNYLEQRKSEAKGGTANLILVGSSMGAYVAVRASANIKPSGLFLLAPALGLAGYPELPPYPGSGSIEVVHGWHDELIPAERVIQWSRQHQATLHLVDDGHRLLEAMPLIEQWFSRFLKDLY